MSRLLLGAVIAVTAVLYGCRPEIGDACKLSTDCSITGDRLCDTSQPDGYCTQFNCEAGSCPSESICVEFHGSADRFARRFCVRHCDSASDCRAGYVCVDPEDKANGRDGKIHEGDPPSRKVCLP
jgi:hypothetical protein